MQLLIVFVVVFGLVGLAACRPDAALAPRRPGAAQLQIMGDLPTIIIANGFTYLPGVGVEVTFGLPRGLFTAAQNGEADFRVVARLAASNLGGQSRGISPKIDPLVLLKVIGSVEQVDFVRMLVPWDGLDRDGTAMTGTTDLAYTLELTNARAPEGTVIGGTLTGLTTLVLP